MQLITCQLALVCLSLASPLASAVPTSASQDSVPGLSAKMEPKHSYNDIKMEDGFFSDPHATGSAGGAFDYELRFKKSLVDASSGAIGIYMQEITIERKFTNDCDAAGEPDCPPGPTKQGYVEWTPITYAQMGIDPNNYGNDDVITIPCMMDKIHSGLPAGADASDVFEAKPSGAGCYILISGEGKLVLSGHPNFNDIFKHLDGNYNKGEGAKHDGRQITYLDTPMGNFETTGFFSGVTDADGDGVEDVTVGPNAEPGIDDRINSDPSGNNPNPGATHVGGPPAEVDPLDPATELPAWSHYVLIRWNYCPNGNYAVIHPGTGHIKRDLGLLFLDTNQNISRLLLWHDLTELLGY